MTTVEHKASINDPVYFIEENSILRGTVQQLVISIAKDSTTILYTIYSAGLSYRVEESEVYTSLIPALDALSEGYE